MIVSSPDKFEKLRMLENMVSYIQWSSMTNNRSLSHRRMTFQEFGASGGNPHCPCSVKILVPVSVAGQSAPLSQSLRLSASPEIVNIENNAIQMPLVAFINAGVVCLPQAVS